MNDEKQRDFVVVREAAPIAYERMFERQLACHAEVAAERTPNTLFLLEHRPVVTLGKEADEAHFILPRDAFEAQGIDVVESNRGGDITYHGPGQLVAYPILNLTHWQRSVGWYLRSLEAVLIDVLAEYGLRGERIAGLTGVWVDGAKVAAIGIGLRKWTTFHGIALNVDPDMAHFEFIVPCGIADRPVTSLAQLLSTTPSMDEVAQHFEAHFRQHFDVSNP